MGVGGWQVWNARTLEWEPWEEPVAEEPDEADALEAEAGIPEPDEELHIDREGFEFYHANFLPHWLRLLPHQFNILSSYTYLTTPAGTPEQVAMGTRARSDIESLTYARKMFLDSGLVTLLKQTEKPDSKTTLADIEAHLRQQPQLMEMAWRCWSAGVQEGIVCHMDFLGNPVYQKTLGIDASVPYEWTYSNAAEWLELEAPPGWRKAYALQGSLEPETYVANLERYRQLGIVDEVNRGEAVLAIGSIGSLDAFVPVPGGSRYRELGERGNRSAGPLLRIVGAVREALGEGHIHALGIGAPDALRVMVSRGWIQSSDSARPTLWSALNEGPYSVKGPRRHYVYLAQMAANAELYEVELYEEIHKAHRKRKNGELDPDELQETLI